MLKLLVAVPLFCCAAAPLGTPPPAELVLRFPSELGTPHITEGETWYAASLEAGDYHLYLSGTSTYVSAPSDMVGTPSTSVRGYDGWETVNEGIRSLTWDAEGRAFDVEVECTEEGDPRCTEPEFLRELAASLEEAS